MTILKKLKLIKNKREICKIRFRKTPRNIHGLSYTIVTDGFIMIQLHKLQDTYNFEIMSVDLSGHCEIEIECYKKDTSNIFVNFCRLLEHDIENVEYSSK